jgi:Glycosyl hydrolase family 71
VRRTLGVWACLAVLLTAVQLIGARTQPSVAAATPQPTANPVPLFAYYYQWFDPSSWNRAKIDYPEIGRYSSDDPEVMRQQIEQAKAAGITGFIVSWKDTPTNTRRLRVLAGLAAQTHFNLAMIYQGLDFNRHPLPVSKVAADFVTFRDKFSHDPVFYRMGGKPLTIWSGTWAYSHADVARVTSAVRPAMLVLSTEKSIDGYRRIADLTDGDAYYWSSVNPSSSPNYGAKLAQMSGAIHADGKYWIAPFASGFDARLIGGTSVVPRNDGATLRAEYSNAVRSSPDALGLISWNEFSENTYVEPSRQYGRRYLDVLAELRTTQPPSPSSAEDSSGALAGGRSGPNRWNLVVLGGLPLLLVVLVSVAARRRRRRDPPWPPADRGTTPIDPPPLSRPGRYR